MNTLIATDLASTKGRFRLRRYFSIASGILMLAVALPLVYTYFRSEVNEHTGLAGTRNALLSTTYANILWPDFGDFLLKEDLTFEERQAHPQTRLLDTRFRQMAGDGQVVKIKVYNLKGVAVYSSVLSEIGEKKDDNPGFLAARDGRQINDLTHRGRMSATEGEIVDVDVVSSYIPVRANKNGPVVAVFELYSDITQTLTRIEVVTWRLLALLVGVFLLLYLALLAIVARADRLIDRQYRALRASEERAAAASRAKSDFLSSMSHELRTPMNAILGFAQLMETEPGSPLSNTQQKFVRQILKAANHLLELINQVLDLSRIEAGKLSLSLEPVNLRALIDDVQVMLQHLLQTRGIAGIDVRLGAEDVVGDNARLKQVLLNLLSNAIKYNRSGGEVEIESVLKASTVRLTVRDTGIGIPPERLGELFQPFSRLGADGGDVEGTGIGLALTKRLMEAMGGRIGVDSIPGVGSRFWIELPVARERVKLGSIQANKLVDASASGSIEATVLYVEDNPANILLMEEIISRLPGLKLVSTHTAELGLAAARSLSPSLIIMDINLPGMDGYEALRRLRADPVHSDVTVYALSANALDSDVERGREAGFDAYFTKPIQVEAFSRAVLEAVRKGANG